VAYIGEMAGTQFDPDLARHFLAMLGEASSNLEAFQRDLERSAGFSAFVVATDRMERALGHAA
jgi:hypothetical protein